MKIETQYTIKKQQYQIISLLTHLKILKIQHKSNAKGVKGNK